MRTHVTFRHPTDFVPVSDEDGILSVAGANWFVSLLRRVPNLDLRDDLCQRSWAWLQRFSPSANRELRRLTRDFHHVLANEAAVSEVTWYREGDMMTQRQSGSATPDEA